MKSRLAVAILAIVAAINIAAVYDDYLITGANAATAGIVPSFSPLTMPSRAQCDDVMFCAEGWVYERASEDGGLFFHCEETESWILCNNNNMCWCYESETCPCPPHPDGLVSAEDKRELDWLIQKRRIEKRSKEKP